MIFNETVSLISLSLIIPAVAFALTVIAIWGNDFFKRLKDDKNPMEWLIIGIVIAFFGSVVDNLYWAFVLSYVYLSGHEISPDLELLGVSLNMLFRQICGIVAGYCHIRSYTQLKGNNTLNKKIWFSSSIIGVIYVMILSVFKR